MKKIWRLTILISIAIVLAILYWYFYIYNPETQIAYWPNGQIRHIYHIAYGGHLHGEQIDYYENGQIYRIMHFKDGQQHGEYISYYENGQIADIHHFDHSESVGESISYRPTGELIGKWNYVDGLPVDGEYIERYENGDIRRKVTYKDGKVDGYDIRYDRNGDISFKYDADWNTVYNKYDEGNNSEILLEPNTLTVNEDEGLCNDIDINRDAEIIEIDDVVENCTYEEGTAYSWDKGGCGGVMPQLYITKEKLGMFDLSDTEILCKSPRAGIIRDLGGHYSDINTFVYKYGLYKKGLIDSVLPQTEEEIGGNKCGFYYCDDENLCSQFYRPSYGDNENHYYIYGYRYTEDFPYEILLVVDDKLYGLGKLEGISENGWPNTRKQGRRIVYGLDGDKLIVKRYVDGELIPPYTLENFNSYSFPDKTTTTKFKVKTCEISL